MKKSEFKQMIKESVKEVLIEEGVLKNVISEVVKAVGQSQVTQSPSPEQLSFTQQASQEAAENKIKQLTALAKATTDAISLRGHHLLRRAAPQALHQHHLLPSKALTHRTQAWIYLAS